MKLFVNFFKKVFTNIRRVCYNMFNRKKRGGCSMLSAQTVANTILMLAFEEDVPVTPMKLQKLMYFAYKDFIRITKQPMFSERFQKWRYGPVLPSIYYAFNDFGERPIKKFTRTATGRVEAVNMKCNSSEATSIDKVWRKYKGYSGLTLSKLTHKKNTAWDKAIENGALKDEDIINEE